MSTGDHYTQKNYLSSTKVKLRQILIGKKITTNQQSLEKMTHFKKEENGHRKSMMPERQVNKEMVK